MALAAVEKRDPAEAAAYSLLDGQEKFRAERDFLQDYARFCSITEVDERFRAEGVALALTSQGAEHQALYNEFLTVRSSLMALQQQVNDSRAREQGLASELSQLLGRTAHESATLRGKLSAQEARTYEAEQRTLSARKAAQAARLEAARAKEAASSCRKRREQAEADLAQAQMDKEARNEMATASVHEVLAKVEREFAKERALLAATERSRLDRIQTLKGELDNTDIVDRLLAAGI